IYFNAVFIDMEQLLLTLKNLTEQRDSLLCKQECPDGWKKFCFKCYRTSKVVGSWNKSREFCVHYGADLVVVESKEELEFISRYCGNICLGQTDEAGEGTWRWVDGTVLSLDNPSWSRGGPDGDEDKNCLNRSLGTGRSQRPDTVSPPWCPIRAVVVLLGLLSVVLLAGLIGLAVKYKTVVEKTVSMDRDMEQLLLKLKNLTEQRVALLCIQCCPSGWVKFGCKCYLFSNKLSWNKSREYCVSHGAELVVADSKEEMDFITRYDSDIWLGATDEAGEGTWRWVDGTVLLLDDPSWSGGGPQGGGDKNCLRVVEEQNQYKWTDESCETRNWGLCQLNVIK
uniref:C-type lectin domain-containing protein n=1 Tax=Gadus morhua TaxID=8049 RepID=A0A8C5FX57_GADMO